MAKSERIRVAVLGAGPIGLEAALYARKLDMAVTVYERSRVGENVQRWGHVRLFSPFGMNSTPLGRATIRAERPKHEFPAEGDCTTVDVDDVVGNAEILHRCEADGGERLVELEEIDVGDLHTGLVEGSEDRA